jgi:hypothetical protein
MDINQAMGGTPQPSAVEEQWHFEMRRKSFDIIRLANPSSIRVQGKLHTFGPHDFYVEYDTHQFQKFPPDTYLDVPRHIAVRYVEHKKDEIINAIAKNMHDDYIKDRDVKGLPRYTDKYTENQETYVTQDYPKSNDPVLIAEIYDQLWVGLVLESGRDIPPPDANNPRSGEVDLKPASEKALENMSKKRVSPDSMPNMGVSRTDRPPMPPPVAPVAQHEPPTISPFAAMNDKLEASEVTSE